MLEGQCPAGHQGGVLAQAVAGTGGRGEADPLDGIEDDQAEHRGGQLGVGRLGELLHRGTEEEVRQIAIGRRGGLFDHFPRGVVDPWLAHAGALRTLSWEGKNQHGYDVSIRRRTPRREGPGR